MVTALLAILSITGIFISISNISISPKASNRVFPLKVFLFITWLIFLIVSIFWCKYYNSKDFLYVFIFIFTLISSIGVAISASERDELGVRIKKQVPKSFIKRILIFPFFTGICSALIYYTIMFLLTITIIAFIDVFYGSYDKGILVVLSGIYLFSLLFAILGYRIKKIKLLQKIKIMTPTIIAILLFLISLLAPVLIMFVLFLGNDIRDCPYLFILSPLGIFESVKDIQYITLISVGLALLLQKRWFIKLFLNQFKAFKNIEIKEKKENINEKRV